MASNNTASSSETSGQNVGDDISQKIGNLQLLIVVTLILVVVLLISQIALFFISRKKNKKNSKAVPSAVVIANEPKRSKKEAKPKGNGAQKSQKSEGQQTCSHLPSKNVMVELDMSDKKEKEKKAEDLPPVVSLPLSAPPAYTPAAVKAPPTSSISEKKSATSSAPSISTAAPLALTPLQAKLDSLAKEQSAATAKNGESKKEADATTAKTAAGTQNSVTVITAADVKTANVAPSVPDVTADLKTANPQASTPKVPTAVTATAGGEKTAKTATPPKNDTGNQRGGIFGMFSK